MMSGFNKPYRADNGKWGVLDQDSTVLYEPEFDRYTEARFVADFHNKHPDAEWERDVMPVFNAQFRPDIDTPPASNGTTPAAVDDTDDKTTYHDLKLWALDNITDKRVLGTLDHLIAWNSELTGQVTSAKQQLADAQSELARVLAKIEPLEELHMAVFSMLITGAIDDITDEQAEESILKLNESFVKVQQKRAQLVVSVPSPISTPAAVDRAERVAPAGKSGYIHTMWAEDFEALRNQLRSALAENKELKDLVNYYRRSRL